MTIGKRAGQTRDSQTMGLERANVLSGENRTMDVPTNGGSIAKPRANGECHGGYYSSSHTNR